MLSVVAIDVGAPRNIGWCRSRGGSHDAQGRDLDGVVAAVADDLDAGRRVAVGFEAPLFVPAPAAANGLNLQRVGERGRPWCAGAGTGALAMGAQQTTYVFTRLAERVGARRVTFLPEVLRSGEADLLVWEAFVTKDAKDRTSLDPHVDDARVAVQEFERRWRAGVMTSDIEEPLVVNLAAAGLLASGLTDDVSLLRMPCLVVRPGAVGAA